MSLITLKQAEVIIDQALAKARQMKLPPLAVVVLDESGHLKAVKREDGASMFRVDVGQGKAWGAVAKVNDLDREFPGLGDAPRPARAGTGVTRGWSAGLATNAMNRLTSSGCAVSLGA